MIANIELPLSVSYLLYIGLPIVIVAAAVGFYFRRRRRIIAKELRRCAETHPAFRESFHFTVSPEELSAHFGLVKKYSRLYGINFARLTRLDDYWIAKLHQHPGKRLFRRVLDYSPDKGLFTCFRAALHRPKLMELFRGWTEKSGEFMPMRSIAHSCSGRDFDGQAALTAFGDNLEELYEMTGDQEWTSRWFAVNILVYAEEERAVRALWSAFSDPSFRIRETAAALFSHEDEEAVYSQLQGLMLDDPVYRVRRTARSRIERDFTSRYRIPEQLSKVQKLHLSELLSLSFQQDREYAFTLIDGEDEELMLEAARLLSDSGALTELFIGVFHEDARSLERAEELLTKAARVHYTGFLEALENHGNPGTILLAAHILAHYGPVRHITTLVQKVRAFGEEQKTRPPLAAIYRESLLCACRRGDDTALTLVAAELADRPRDALLHETILPELPREKAHIYVDKLFSFLRNPGYRNRDTLRDNFTTIEPSLVLPELFGIIKTRDTEAREVQGEALKILSEMRMPYTIQHVLEHLPLLSLHNARRYAALLAEHSRSVYIERVRLLLAGPDSRIRSRVIASIPEELRQEFIDEIRSAVKDSDPDVRIAAALALISSGTKEDRSHCLHLLRDPVDRVREEVAATFARHTSGDTAKELRRMLFDPNEMPPVKRSLIAGLSESSDTEAVDLIIEVMAAESELQHEAALALSQKQGRNAIERILSHISSASPEVRSLLVESLKSMGESAESVLESLLFDLDHPLREVTIEVLESIGSVDNRIRHLTNRDPSVRREAAAFLHQVATKNAYRGLVQAARDPDEEVRAYVIKALDALDSDKGRALLEELQSDPERRIRTYTAWALERHRARKL
jgi:HEAT repeat protein